MKGQANAKEPINGNANSRYDQRAGGGEAADGDLPQAWPEHCDVPQSEVKVWCATMAETPMIPGGGMRTIGRGGW